MKRQRKLEIMVGFTVLVAIFSVIFVIFWGRGALFTGETQLITMTFNQVGGLTPSDVVSVSGVNVGRVKSVEIVHDSVKVVARIDKEISLRKDATAAIVNAELMGGKKIELNPGQLKKMWDPNHQIVGEYVPGIMDLADVIENREDDFNTLFSDLITSVKSLKKLLGNDSEREGNLQTVMENLSSTTARVDTLMQVNSKAVETTLKNLEESSNILRNFLGKEESRAKSLLSAGERISEQIEALSDSTQYLIDKMNDPSTTIGQLVAHDSLYRQISRSVVSLDSLLTDIKKHPNRYVNVKVSPF